MLTVDKKTLPGELFIQYSKPALIPIKLFQIKLYLLVTQNDSLMKNKSNLDIRN